MIMADNSRSALPRLAMRGDEYGRIDLEAVLGLLRDIGGSAKFGDGDVGRPAVRASQALAQEEAAAFQRGGGLRLRADRIAQRS